MRKRFKRSAKKWLSMLLVFCMVLSILPVSVLAAEPKDPGGSSSNPFTDVKLGQWYYDAVQYSYTNKFFVGITDTIFDPQGTMTRGMFVTVLGRMAGVDTSAYTGQSSFSDVPANEYYAPYVAWAAKYGVTQGTGDGNFSPKAFVTRQEMATFFVRYFETFGATYETGANITTTPGDLDEIASYAQESVLKLWKQGLLIGDGKNFLPKGKATRAETATLCMRTDRAVPIWFKEPGVPSGRVSVDPSAPIYAVKFFDGDKLIDTMHTRAGTTLSELPSAEKYSKANAIFAGWYVDPDCTLPFYTENPITDSMNVYAKYEEMGDTEVLNLTSYAQMDQSPDLSFTIKKLSGDTSPEEAAVLTVKDGSDPVDISIIKNASGTYTVKAERGFNEGCSYELTLADGWVFVDNETGEEKPDTIRTASFSIAMEEVENLEMSDSITYIKDTDSINYTLDGKTYEELTSDLVTDAGGSFQYAGASQLKPDDVICIYVGMDPRDRTPDSGAALLDPAVYVKVAAVSGQSVTFAKLADEDQQEIYNVPDNFPILVAQLPSEKTGTANINALDLDMYKTMMGAEYDLAKAKESITPGDFVTLYISRDAIRGESSLYYGEITAYNKATGEITYKQTTREAILACMDLYQDITLKGSDLVTDEEKAQMEATLQAQVSNSGFAEEAAFAVADIIAKTDNFRENLSVREFLLTDENGNELSDEEIELLNLGASFELSDDIELKVELITDGDQLHFGDSVQLAIGVKAKFEVDAAEGKVAIDLNATFVQEVQIDPRVKGEVVYKEILWIPIPIGVSVGASVDIYSYTALSFSAEIYTVAEEDTPIWDKIKNITKDPKEVLGLANLPDGLANGLKTAGDVLDKIDELKNKIDEGKETAEKLKGYAEDIESLWAVIEDNDITTKEAWESMGKQLGKTSITSDLLEMMNMTTDTELSTEYLDSMQALMDKYSEMLEKETDWITLVEEEITTAEVNISGIAIGVEVKFIVRADMSLAIGSNLEYEIGKRYNFWFRIGLFKPTAGSDSMDLIDEHFAFQFYVMGKLGVKAGVRAKVYVGIGTGKFASVGITTELGPYIKLYGFFVYEYEKYRPANTQDWTYGERLAGALYLEFGLYFMLGFEANALGDLFEYSHDFLDLEVPLLTAGESRYYYGNAYEPQEDEVVIVRDEDGNSTNGITMTLPDSTLALSYIDLDTGVQGKQSLDYDKYIYTLSNSNFHLNNKTGTISVTVPGNTRYMECDLTITYKYGKMAFSTYDMTVTVPLVWTNLSTAELSEYYTAAVRVGNNTDGYQTVWSKRVLKNQPFNLPTEREIKEMIGWNDYKYTASTGYGDQQLEDLTLIEDTTYDYQVDYRTYSLTVNGIQNADGSTRSETYTAKYGEAFDFSDLAGTGTMDDDNKNYTKFSQLTTDATITVNGEEVPLDLTQKLNSKMADKLSSGVTATAQYVDNSVTVTFTFTGLTHEDVSYTIQKGTEPPLTEIEAIVSDNGLDIKETFPAIGKANASTVYQVICGELEGDPVNITFHSNGGSAVSTISKVPGSLIGTLPAPTKTGYSFSGWYTDNGTFSQEFTQRKVPVGGAELYAKWTANEYTVTFNVSGGNNLAEGQETKSVTYDGTYGDLPAPTKSGYGFVGWFTAAEGGTQVSADTLVTTAADQTLYAHWAALKDIPADVFNFGEAEGGTYSKDQTHEVMYTFVPEEGATYQQKEFTFRYMRQGNSEYESGLPINAGTYNVTVSRPADNTYAKFEQTYTAVITIDKAVRTLGAVDICTFDPGMTWMNLQLDGDGGIYDLSDEASFTYQLVKKSGNGPDGHTSASADRDSLVTGLFPGTEYYVTVKVTDDPNYTDAESTLDGASVVTTLSAPTGNWADYADTNWYDSSLTEFTLTTAAQLAGLAQLVNNGTNFSGKTVKLGADIDLMAYQWTPIGNSSRSFQGTFDGQNHRVCGMYASSMSGLFGNLRNAAIQNVTLEDSYVTGSSIVGGIVGYAYTDNQRSVISNCVVEKTVTVYGTSSGDSYTGGIAGACLNEYTLTGCKNWGTVYGGSKVGGIVGACDDAIIITNCVNYGPIHGTGSYIGGITGYTYDECNVLNSANFGSVTGNDCVGGIVGKTERKATGKQYPNNVLNCYNVGTVYGSTYVGAIVGGRHTTNDAVHQCYYLQGCAKNSNGTVCKAVGINGTGSTDSGDNLQIAYFSEARGSLIGNGGCGTDNLITALNNWVSWWNDKQCNARWVEGSDGYPLPTGKINTNKGSKT